LAAAVVGSTCVLADSGPFPTVLASSTVFDGIIISFLTMLPLGVADLTDDVEDDTDEEADDVIGCCCYGKDRKDLVRFCCLKHEERKKERETERESVCVRERERERERDREKETERNRDREEEGHIDKQR
jgi:hypothetical protein